MILGLTGGIGSGKSTVSKIFLSMGIKVFDADLIAKDILETEEVKEEIKEKLGKEFINLKSNSVDKKLLKKEIFNNPKKLEDIKEIVIFDVPLLFEVKLEKYCDKVIVVDIDPEVQIERIRKRDNIDIGLIKKIIGTQIPRENRNLKADIVVENNGTLEELKQKIKEIINEIERGKV